MPIVEPFVPGETPVVGAVVRIDQARRDSDYVVPPGPGFTVDVTAFRPERAAKMPADVEKPNVFCVMFIPGSPRVFHCSPWRDGVAGYRVVVPLVKGEVWWVEISDHRKSPRDGVTDTTAFWSGAVKVQ